jgi:hypothetical protein
MRGVLEAELALAMESDSLVEVRAGPVFAALASPALLYYVCIMLKSTTVIQKSKKKMGRPPIGERPSGVFPFRLPEETIAAVDGFAEREGIKTRSEAVRCLPPRGLTCGTVTQPEAKQAAKRKGGK